jgi:hypothetical protein
MAACEATNSRGLPCEMPAVTGSAFCFAHDPERAADRREARRQGGLNRRSAISGEPVNISTSADVLDLIGLAVGDTLAQENSANRSRALATLLQVALRALEVGNQEERLARLEGLLDSGGGQIQ